MIFGIIWITLLVLLATKELSTIIGSEFALRLSGFLTKPIMPLLVLFVLIVVLTAFKILELDLLESILFP